jgi:hypothetical protein
MHPLPIELIVSILSHLSVSQLTHVRRVNRLWNRICIPMLNEQVSQLTLGVQEKLQLCESTLAIKQSTIVPHLRHYGNFLNTVNQQELREASWYHSPPRELQVVCECLVSLKEGSNGEPMAWSAVRKSLSKTDSWLTQLKDNLHQIPSSGVLRAEHLIVTDPMITYDRLRSVSQVGFKLLVVVAAILQLYNITSEVHQLKSLQIELKDQQRVYEAFLKVCKQ